MHEYDSSLPLVSVVVPVYGARENLAELCRRLLAVATPIAVRMEIILVNDASPDGAWDTIRALSEDEPRIKGVNFLRNFGQHFAITAGLSYASGDWVVVMDCDLQDLPEEIPKMYRKAQEGFDVVFGRRTNRQDSLSKRFTSFAFSTVLSAVSGVKVDSSIGNYSIVSKRAVDGLLKLTERHRSYGLLIRWVGLKTAYVDIEHAKRASGKSGYSFARAVQLATDIAVSYTTSPLLYSVYLGFSAAGLAVIASLYYAYRYVIHGVGVTGWTSTIISIWFLGGAILVNSGVMGLYLGKVFEQVKRRPLFLVDETLNMPSAIPPEPPSLLQIKV